MSRLGFAEIARLQLQATHPCAVDASGTLQPDQELLDRIEFDYVPANRAI
jgi:hypothetical protein